MLANYYFRFWSWLEDWLDPPDGPPADLHEILARPLTAHQRETVENMARQAEGYGGILLAEEVEWALAWIEDHPARLDGSRPGNA